MGYDTVTGSESKQITGMSVLQGNSGYCYLFQIASQDTAICSRENLGDGKNLGTHVSVAGWWWP